MSSHLKVPDRGLRHRLSPLLPRAATVKHNKTLCLVSFTTLQHTQPTPTPILSPTIRSPQRRRCASCETWLWPQGPRPNAVPKAAGKRTLVQEGQQGHRHRAGHPTQHLPHCLPPQPKLPVGEATRQGGVSSPQRGTKTRRGGPGGQLPPPQRNPQLRKGFSWQITPQPQLGSAQP